MLLVAHLRTAGILRSATLCCICLASSLAVAAPAADTIFPASTKGFFSIPNFPDANSRWRETQIGQLLDDPAMEPFMQDLRRQLRDKFAENSEKLGTTWEDLEGAAAGEVAIGVVHAPKLDPGFAVVVDVTGKIPAAQKLLEKVAQDLANRSARHSQKAIGNAKVEVFEIPPAANAAEQKPQFAYYVLQGDLLIASDELPILEGILRRVAKPADNLASLPNYQQVMTRLQQGAQNKTAQARWFIDPFGLGAALQAARPAVAAGARSDAPPATNRPGSGARPAVAAPALPAPASKSRKPDRLATARNLGFGAIQAAGGLAVLASDPFDLLHYTAIHAPQPWEKSMKLLAFPNSNDLTALPWVPGGVDLHVAFNMDIKTAEANFEPVFDQMFGEGEKGVWTDVKESLRDDPNGPGIDLVKDLVNNLGQRLTFVVDHHTPVTPTCERTCLGITTPNEKALAAAIKKSMAGDPNVKLRQFQGFEIWEMVEEKMDVPQVEIEENGKPAGDQAGADGGPPDRLLPKSAISVAKGHLFIASHVDFLEAILKQEAGNSLAADKDYQAIAQQMGTFGTAQNSFQVFVRQDQAIESTYELLRTNRMDEAQTMLGTVITKLLAAQQGDQERKSEIDGSKLPPFEQMRKYLGFGGMTLTTEPTGWFGVGFVPRNGTAQVGSRPANASAR